MTLNMTWQEFKRVAMDFHFAAATLNEDELENAWKALGLAYLGMNEPVWQHSAAMLLEMEARTYWNRVLDLSLEKLS